MISHAQPSVDRPISRHVVGDLNDLVRPMLLLILARARVHLNKLSMFFLPPPAIDSPIRGTDEAKRAASGRDGTVRHDGSGHPLEARTIATMPARIALGSVGQASMTADRSGSDGADLTLSVALCVARGSASVRKPLESVGLRDWCTGLSIRWLRVRVPSASLSHPASRGVFFAHGCDTDKGLRALPTCVVRKGDILLF